MTLGIYTPNHSGFPIIEVPLAKPDDIGALGRFLFAHGVYATLAAYPLVPRQEVGFRLQLTAANTDAEVDQLIEVLGKLANAFDLQPAERAVGVTLSGVLQAGRGLAAGISRSLRS